MPRKESSTQVSELPTNSSTNGHCAIPREDIFEEPSVENPSQASTAINLDELLGDEEALRHDMLADTEVPIDVRRPRKREFHAVHPTYERIAVVVEHSVAGSLGRSYYATTKTMRARMEEEDLKRVKLVLCQSLSDRSWFVCPLNLDEAGRSENLYNRSALQFAEDAKGRFARRVNRGRAYVAKFAPEGTPPPTWPETPWVEILAEVFRERTIDSQEHPVYVELERGI
jgi:hypothetical protein